MSIIGKYLIFFNQQKGGSGGGVRGGSACQYYLLVMINNMMNSISKLFHAWIRVTTKKKVECHYEQNIAEVRDINPRKISSKS